MQNDFTKLGVQIANISTDNVTEHKRWKTWLEGLDYKGRGPQKIEFPIIDDHSHVASIKLWNDT
jgi:peroxiredoxin (alkyl hydroperoxide reductase subunit C)